MLKAKIRKKNMRGRPNSQSSNDSKQSKTLPAAAKRPVFIAQRGVRSLRAAQAIRTWLRNACGKDLCWISKDTRDIGVWHKQLMQALDMASAGIICLTPENLKSPWLFFEAGAVAKAVNQPEEDRYVAPFLLGISDETKVPAPLTKFRFFHAHNKSEVISMGVNIFKRCQIMDTDQATIVLTRHWKDLKTSLRQSLKTPPEDSDEGPILEESLKTNRIKEHAQEINRWYGSKDSGQRFLSEMLLHRLNLMKASPLSEGVTISWHVADLPENRRSAGEAIPRETIIDEYAAIFDVATALRTASPERFDTVVFRDMGVWANPNYWETNTNLDPNVGLRRVFIYDNTFFRNSADSKEKRIGLFCGVWMHEHKKLGDWRVIHHDDLVKDQLDEGLCDIDRNRKRYRRNDSLKTQGSAAIGEKAVVFVRLEDKNSSTLSARFYLRDPNSEHLCKVTRFQTSFNRLFKTKEYWIEFSKLRQTLLGKCKSPDGRQAISRAMRIARRRLTKAGLL